VAVLAVPAAGLGALLSYGLLAGILIALFERQSRRAERAANDPPRPDYETPTKAQPPHVKPAVLVGTWLAPVAIPATESVRQSAALLSAAVRGLERAQGAIDAGERAVGRLRLEEARSFAHDLGLAGQQSDQLLSALATELTTVQLEPVVPREPDGGGREMETFSEVPPPGRLVPFWADFPYELKEQLTKAGVHPREMTLSQEELSGHRRDPARALRRAGKTFASLGEEFRAATFGA
jgi:hypothetical protein